MHQEPYLTTQMGSLFDGDCLNILPSLASESIDMIFADPPFNLGKEYGTMGSDQLPDSDYIAWCKEWLTQCIRVLSPGGAIFIYHLPRWNIELGYYMSALGLEFRHWIAIDNGSGFPIRGRLYPAHYSMLYYTKGKPRVFNKIRTPVELCRHCGHEVKDYGGHRKALHQDGVSLKDIWTDVPVVRHRKYKAIGRRENALSSKIVSRAILLTTCPGDIVLDPFGGSGTTYAACESLRRRWIGIELNDYELISERLTNNDVFLHPTKDIVECACQ